MAIFRKDYESACDFLQRACPKTADQTEILDPRGPWPYTEGWKRSFFLGTLRLLLDKNGALEALRDAEKLRSTAEGANNLGVSLDRQGRVLDAQIQYRLACQRLPGYRDALLNQGTGMANKLITPHPLRSHASRDQYDLIENKAGGEPLGD